jgi:hypothetical protein
MRRKETVRIAVVALFFGLLGGAISQRLLNGDSVLAQAKEVKAQEFRLLDQDDNVLGVWTIDPTGEAVIMLFDKQNRLVWRAPPQAGVTPLKRGPSD